MFMSIDLILDCLNDPSSAHYCDIDSILKPQKSLDESLIIGDEANQSIYQHFNEKYFEDRLERDKNINIKFSQTHDKALEMELNFLEASTFQNINYCNLGSYLKYVKQEFDRATIHF